MRFIKYIILRGEHLYLYLTYFLTLISWYSTVRSLILKIIGTNSTSYTLWGKKCKSITYTHILTHLNNPTWHFIGVSKIIVTIFSFSKFQNKSWRVIKKSFITENITQKQTAGNSHLPMTQFMVSPSNAHPPNYFQQAIFAHSNHSSFFKTQGTYIFQKSTAV